MQKKNYYNIIIAFVIFFFYQNSFASVFEGIPRIIDGDSLEIDNNKIDSKKIKTILNNSGASEVNDKIMDL